MSTQAVSGNNYTRAQASFSQNRGTLYQDKDDHMIYHLTQGTFESGKVAVDN